MSQDIAFFAGLWVRKTTFTRQIPHEEALVCRRGMQVVIEQDGLSGLPTCILRANLSCALMFLIWTQALEMPQQMILKWLYEAESFTV